MYLPENAIENVYWIILVTFCGLAILSWWVARKDWLTEEPPAAEDHQEQNEEPPVITKKSEQE